MNSAAEVDVSSLATSEPVRHESARDTSGVGQARNLTDDEILGLGARNRTRKRAESTNEFAAGEKGSARSDLVETSDPWDESLAHQSNDPSASLGRPSDDPELQELRSDANAYQEIFATPAEAQAAKARLANVEILDNLFFSRRPEDHAELARIVAQMDPDSFELLAAAISQFERPRAKNNSEHESRPIEEISQSTGARTVAADQPLATSPIQQQFLQDTNGAAVRGVLDAIESQADKVLPEGISRTARNRLIGEIYREVEQSLEANSEFGRQIRTSIRSGDFGPKHRDAIVSLITSRARQALPGATKKVVDEWTSTMVAAHQDRRTKQRTAESRIDIGGTKGSSSEGRKPHSPRTIDYKRMSDADILNL